MCEITTEFTFMHIFKYSSKTQTFFLIASFDILVVIKSADHKLRTGLCFCQIMLHFKAILQTGWRITVKPSAPSCILF